jgi:hypothetical protein
VLPFCNTETMSPHLAEISLMVAPGAHAVVLMDQAGWRWAGKLAVPENISIVALPAKCPGLTRLKTSGSSSVTPSATAVSCDGERECVGSAVAE